MDSSSSNLTSNTSSYPQNATCMRLSGLFQFQPFFVRFFSLFQIKTKFIKFCTKFFEKPTTFFPSKCCAANPSSAIACVFSKILKTVRAVRVNETKVTLRNAFLFNAFILRSKKNKKNDKRIFFWDCSWSVDLSLKPQPPNATYMSFLDYFSFSHF